MADLAAAYAEQTAGTGVANTGRYGGVVAPPPTTTINPTPYVTPKSGGVLQKVADVGRQGLDIAGFLAEKGTSFIAHTGIDIAKQTYGAAKTFVDIQTQPIQNKMIADATKQLDQAQSNIMAAYKSGKMSKENYTEALKQLSGAYSDLSKESQKISSGPTPGQRAMDVVNTAVNALSLGSVGLAEVGAKEALQAGSTEALHALVDESASSLEKVAMQVPSLRALIERNLAQGAVREGQQVAGETAEQYLLRNGRKVAVDLLIKRPVFYQTNIAQADDLYNAILNKNPGGAVAASAWLGIQMVEGGPLGVVSKGGSWVKSAISKGAKGKQSYIDELSKLVGSGDANQGAEYILKNKNAEKTFRIAQELNLKAANNDVAQAVESTLRNYDDAGVNRATITFKQLHQDLQNWADAEASKIGEIKAGKIKGVKPEDLSKYAVVRWDSVMKQGLKTELAKAGENKASQLAVLSEVSSRPGVGWSNNDILMTKLKNILNGKGTLAEKTKAIDNITTASTAIDGMSKTFANKLGKLGYTVAAPQGGNKIAELDYKDVIGSTRKLVSAAQEGDTSVFDLASAPNPTMATIANGLQRAGISPEASSQVANRKLSESVVSSLDQNGMASTLGITRRKGDPVAGGQAVLSRLQTYLDNKRGILGIPRSTVQDIRQLTKNEISEALGVNKSEAKQVAKAIMDGYMKVPLEFRGLGDKMADFAYKINPLEKTYMRAQGAMRFTYNPFFQVRADVKTRFAAHAEANTLIWGKSKATLDDGASVLRKSGILGGALPDEATQDNVIGRITANLTKSQERQVAGLAFDLAEKRGITIDQLVKNHYPEVEDLLRTSVQYPRTGFLASPMARTLNLMFFPMRFNIKIAQLSAKVIAAQPPSVQMAIIHSGFKLSSWLKSDEGIRWQSAHADALEVFNYITPAHSIEQTLSLLNGHPDSIASLGELGGLPFGFISQILDAEGIIHLNKPYVDPKTGTVLPDYIPKTAKAQASVALVDLLSSMFTYPGATLGLPGKQKTVRSVVQNFIATNGKDFDKQIDTAALTPLQKNWVRVLKGDTSEAAVNQLYNSPAPGQFNWYTLPPNELPIVSRPTTQIQPLAKRTGLPTKSTSRSKKTALPIPQR